MFAMSNYELVAVAKRSAGNLLAHCSFSNDRDVVGQFSWCVNGGEDGKTTCTALIDTQSGRMVGFVGLSLSCESFGEDVNAYVCIEFIFIQSDLRQKKLSRKLISSALQMTKKWLRKICATHDARNIQMYSASSPKSENGELVVRRFESGLVALAEIFSIRIQTTEWDD